MSWHTFRHTFSTLLKGNGEDVKVVQELLRHSTAKMTLDTYTQALSPQKRAAQSKVVWHDPLETKLYRRCTASFW
jgi:integrase